MLTLRMHPFILLSVCLYSVIPVNHFKRNKKKCGPLFGTVCVCSRVCVCVSFIINQTDTWSNKRSQLPSCGVLV